MAFVKAEKNGKTIEVSRSTYETIFKKQGYKLVGHNSNMYSEQEEMYTDDDYEETEQNGEELDVLETTPISEMDKNQLLEYCKRHDIDTSAAKNVREAREIVKSVIKERKM